MDSSWRLVVQYCTCRKLYCRFDCFDCYAFWVLFYSKNSLVINRGELSCRSAFCQLYSSVELWRLAFSNYLETGALKRCRINKVLISSSIRIHFFHILFFLHFFTRITATVVDNCYKWYQSPLFLITLMKTRSANMAEDAHGKRMDAMEARMEQQLDRQDQLQAELVRVQAAWDSEMLNDLMQQMQVVIEANNTKL